MCTHSPVLLSTAPVLSHQTPPFYPAVRKGSSQCHADCQQSLLWKCSGGVRAASFDMTLVFSSSLGRRCLLQMCHLVSCPEQVLCPRRNQLNILRQKVETQPPPVTPPSPPPPSSVYDVSTRITLHPICPHHGTTLPFPALPWYRQHQHHHVKHKQYVCTSRVLVTLLLCLLRVSILVPLVASLVRKSCTLPCQAAPLPLPAVGQHRAARVGPGGAPGATGRWVSRGQEGSGDLSPTVYCRVSQGRALPSWRMIAQ